MVVETKVAQLGYVLKVESREFTDALASMAVGGKDKIKNYF